VQPGKTVDRRLSPCVRQFLLELAHLLRGRRQLRLELLRKSDELPRLSQDRRRGGQYLARPLGLGQAVDMPDHGLVGQRGLARDVHQGTDDLGNHPNQLLADILDQGLAGHTEKALEKGDGVVPVQRPMLFQQFVDLLVEAHVLAGDVVVEKRVIERRRGDTELAQQGQCLAQVLGRLFGRIHVEHQRRWILLNELLRAQVTHPVSIP